MEKLNLDEMTKSLVDKLGRGLYSHKPWFYPQLLGLLVKGKPVPIEKISTTLQMSGDDVRSALDELPNLEFDQEGNLVGAALTLTPTPHHFQVHGRKLYTWCAFDTLFFPVVLNLTAYVESQCHVTGSKINLKVTPNRIEELDPSNTVVSLVIPTASDACCDIRGSFCDKVHFFSSPEVAATWLVKNKEAMILSVDDAYKIGQKLVEHIFKKSSGS